MGEVLQKAVARAHDDTSTGAGCSQHPCELVEVREDFFGIWTSDASVQCDSPGNGTWHGVNSADAPVTPPEAGESSMAEAESYEVNINTASPKDQANDTAETQAVQPGDEACRSPK